MLWTKHKIRPECIYNMLHLSLKNVFLGNYVLTPFFFSETIVIKYSFLVAFVFHNFVLIFIFFQLYYCVYAKLFIFIWINFFILIFNYTSCICVYAVHGSGSVQRKLPSLDLKVKSKRVKWKMQTGRKWCTWSKTTVKRFHFLIN